MLSPDPMCHTRSNGRAGAGCGGCCLPLREHPFSSDLLAVMGVPYQQSSKACAPSRHGPALRPKTGRYLLGTTLSPSIAASCFRRAFAAFKPYTPLLFTWLLVGGSSLLSLMRGTGKFVAARPPAKHRLLPSFTRRSQNPSAPWVICTRVTYRSSFRWNLRTRMSKIEPLLGAGGVYNIRNRMSSGRARQT